MITKLQAQEYLATVGVNLPDFLLDALLAQIATTQECLELHYSAPIALLIQSYLLGLMGLSQGDRYISSQTAPSGASRSFRYVGMADRWRGLTGLLRGLDKYGCTLALVPPNPTGVARGGLWVSRGGCNSC